MSWVKASDKFPFMDWHISRIVGTEKRFPALYTTNVIAGIDGKTYKRDEIEWLETRDVSFSLQDMKDACLAGANWGDGTSSEKPVEWFKRVYDIDITK